MQGDIALSSVVGALSYALDITEGQPEGHALRSSGIGMRIAQELALPGEVPSDLFYVGPAPDPLAPGVLTLGVPAAGVPAQNLSAGPAAPETRPVVPPSGAPSV